MKCSGKNYVFYSSIYFSFTLSWYKLRAPSPFCTSAWGFLLLCPSFLSSCLEETVNKVKYAQFRAMGLATFTRMKELKLLFCTTVHSGLCAAIFNVTTLENLSDLLELYKRFAALWGFSVLFGLVLFWFLCTDLFNHIQHHKYPGCFMEINWHYVYKACNMRAWLADFVCFMQRQQR